MANPQKENGYTGIANEILEHLVKLPLNGTQWRIIAIVWRYTYGFSRKEHNLSVNFIALALDFKNTQYKQVSRELNKLIGLGILIETVKPDKNKTRTIAFNKNYDLWTKKSSGLIRPEDELDQREGSKKSIDAPKTSGLKSPVRKQGSFKTNSKTSILSAFFNKIWNLYPHKVGKARISDKQKQKLYAIGLEEITRCIDRYLTDLKKEEWRKPQNGSTFFNSGYVDYLDANYSKETKINKKSDFTDTSRYENMKTW